VTLPVQRAHRLEPRPESQRWLIEGLWSDQAVGIIGGAPKSCKSLCALDLAVSVSSGAPCLGHFATHQTGPVLLFAGEDPLELLRERLDGIARASGQELGKLDIFVITAPRLQLDVEADREQLSTTVERFRPKLLVLDPFVRLHSGDENAVAEVAPLLGSLRNLQRRFGCSVLLVHHARKNAAGLRGGQALRGSSELFAWTDSILHLRRKGNDLLLSAEHRAAPGLDELVVELRPDAGGLALRVSDCGPAPDHPILGDTEPPLDQRIVDVLGAASEPLTPRRLRDECKVRMARIYESIAELVDAGRLVRDGSGYRLAAMAPSATATRLL
jgi:hypothetical protein